ncbi:24914_t:CDS:1, partial [Gigaspora rosea]
RSLPHFGQSTFLTPAAYSKLCNNEISRPTPNISEHTEPTSKWIMPLPIRNG